MVYVQFMSVTVPEAGPSSHSSDLLNRFAVNPMQTFTPKAKANKDITCKSKTAKLANRASSRTFAPGALCTKGRDGPQYIGAPRQRSSHHWSTADSVTAGEEHKPERAL